MRALLVISSGLLVTACVSVEPSDPGEALSGGDTTAFDTTRDAYTKSARNLTFAQRAVFGRGNNFFSDRWVSAPASVKNRDGLGPLFNSASCSGCHLADGRGQPPEPGHEMSSMLVRLSIPGAGPHGEPLDEPTYGGQLQPFAVQGVAPEAHTDFTFVEDVNGTYADGTSYTLRTPRLALRDFGYGPMDQATMFSARVGPMVFGLGLFEAVSDDVIVAMADPQDSDGDGISGEANRVWSESEQRMRIGRFGWKAGQPTVLDQITHAFAGDMGITTSVLPGLQCTSAQNAMCAAVPDGNESDRRECDDDTLDSVQFYSQTLAVPARRDVDDGTVRRGKALFASAGCESCHVPRIETGDHEIPQLARQTIRPYTDLLLHDMGEGLADHRPEYDADGREWRTAPLWGLGLLQRVNGHQYLLHDGRARGFAEAILWHGGEAEASRESFRAMSADERAALVRFLESL
jgi:CxxC motif-containing protein (DUF1111 family)